MRRRTTMKSVVALLALLVGALVFLSRPVSALTGPYGDAVPSQQVKSPATRTPRAFGAHTVKRVPATP